MAMSKPLYPALKSILGASYADLAALPPDTVASIELALRGANSLVDVLERELREAGREISTLEDELLATERVLYELEDDLT